jgi:hypothetical protein
MVSTGALFNEQVFVFAFDNYSAFSLLQSTVHSIWAAENSSRQGAAVRYSVTKAFETFPFPDGRWTTSDLQDVGLKYHQFRDEFMQVGDEGLTTIYNHFHDFSDRSADISQLRELHIALDVAVLKAYGWNDLAANVAPEFLNNDNEPDQRYQGRLFWPRYFREEVLARLLDLNKKRADEERRLGITVRPGAANIDLAEEEFEQA